METIAEKIETYENMLRKSEIFDLNLWWDPVFREGFRTYDDWDKQWNEYTRFGLNQGLVTSAKASRYDALAGNAELAELLEDTGSSLELTAGLSNESSAELSAGASARLANGSSVRLSGCMVLTPDMFYKHNGETYIDELMSRGFIAARLFPATYMHSMKPFTIRRLLEALEIRNLPLLLWHTQVSFEEMDRICEAHPGLNIIVEGHNMKLLYHARQYMPLLMQRRNFFLETHNLVLYREFETINSLAGCGNLLYGSYFPYNTPHASLYPIFAAEIEDGRRDGILCGNARRLFCNSLTVNPEIK